MWKFLILKINNMKEKHMKECKGQGEKVYIKYLLEKIRGVKKKYLTPTLFCSKIHKVGEYGKDI